MSSRNGDRQFAKHLPASLGNERLSLPSRSVRIKSTVLALRGKLPPMIRQILSEDAELT
jgi:hypothetical protein